MMMKLIIPILALIAVGCAGKTPELKQYLLRTETPGQIEQQAPATTGIGSLTVASYIDAPGLVLEASDVEVRAARHHQWAEPLRESLRRFLASEIAAATGRAVSSYEHRESNWKWRIDIHIDQLHGDADGSARLVAYWAVTNAGDLIVLSERGFSDSEPLSGEGYEALVRAEKKLLSKLAAAIAKALP
jgi:uncharacterized lipoprotein YmbA